MSSYDPPARPRRDGRPRYYDDDASDEESYYAPPRRNRRAPPEDRRLPPDDRRPDDRRPPPPPDDRRPPPPPDNRWPPPPPPEDNLPPPPFPLDHPRRPSILVSPDETASQKAVRRRSRSIEKVRLQASSSDDDYGSRRGPPRPKPSREISHDLERKTTDENKRFRSKRNDYESDEGETLRKSRRPSEGDPGKSRRRDYEDYGGDDDGATARYPPERKDNELARIKDKASLPLRGKPRAVDGRDARNEPPVEYGAAPIAAVAGGAATGAAVAAAGRPRLRGYDTDPGRQPRPRTWAEDDFKRERRRNRDPDRYDDDDYYERRAPRPRPRPTFVDDAEDTYGRSRGGGRGGPARRRDRYEDDVYDDYRRRERDDPYRAERDRDRDRDRNGGLMPTRPRYDGYYSDSREDRAYPRDRDRNRDRGRVRDRDRDRDRDVRDRDVRDRDFRDRDFRDRDLTDRDLRDDYYDRRPRDMYRDDYYDRRDRDGRRGGSGSLDWQRQAGILFTRVALPVIKREGSKFVKKELANFIEKRGTGI